MAGKSEKPQDQTREASAEAKGGDGAASADMAAVKAWGGDRCVAHRQGLLTV